MLLFALRARPQHNSFVHLPCSFFAAQIPSWCLFVCYFAAFEEGAKLYWSRLWFRLDETDAFPPWMPAPPLLASTEEGPKSNPPPPPMKSATPPGHCVVYGDGWRKRSTLAFGAKSLVFIFFVSCFSAAPAQKLLFSGSQKVVPQKWHNQQKGESVF